jgi:hypothetical protein
MNQTYHQFAFFANKYEKQRVAILHDARRASTPGNTLISQVDQPSLIETGMSNL